MANSGSLGNDKFCLESAQGDNLILLKIFNFEAQGNKDKKRFPALLFCGALTGNPSGMMLGRKNEGQSILLKHVQHVKEWIVCMPVNDVWPVALPSGQGRKGNLLYLIVYEEPAFSQT